MKMIFVFLCTVAGGTASVWVGFRLYRAADYRPNEEAKLLAESLDRKSWRILMVLIVVGALIASILFGR